jgi:hypothetical protein
MKSVLFSINIILILCAFIFFYSISFAQNSNYKLSTPQIIIPSASLPKEVKSLHSNNNVDIITYNGYYYVAFRTASHHFPNKKAKIYVIKSIDLNNWKFEHSISLHADLREPRFAMYNNNLFLYFFEGGKSPFRFQPKHVWVSKLDTNTHTWNNKIIDGLDGYVPWRLKVRNDTLLLSAYWGKDLYGDHQGNLRLFVSKNGIDWLPISNEPQIAVTGAEEGEFEFDQEGNLWACIRLEGEGALICYADKQNIHQWNTFKSKKKYDSSCMFRHKNDIYLIARRNKDGDFSKTPKWLPESIVRGYNLTRYSLTPKTTALYKLNKQTKDFEWVIDLPGCGDNAFPAITKKNENSYIVLNYSNDFENPNISWLTGQLSKTFIYSIELTILE